MGLEVRPRSVCVYLHMGMPEWECVWDWVVFTVMRVEGARPTQSHEQRSDCAADGVGWMAWAGSGEKVGQNVSPEAAPWQVAERPLSHYIPPYLSNENHQR